MRKRVDLGVFGRVPVNPAQARQRVLAVDVHGARAADALAAGPTEGERWVDLVLDLDESVQHLIRIPRSINIQAQVRMVSLESPKRIGGGNHEVSRRV